MIVDFTPIDRQRRVDRLRAEAAASGETEDEAAVRALKRMARQMERARARGVWREGKRAEKREPMRFAGVHRRTIEDDACGECAVCIARKDPKHTSIDIDELVRGKEEDLCAFAEDWMWKMKMRTATPRKGDK